VTSDPTPLTRDEINEIYRSLIESTLFDDFPGGESAPTLVLLGGQPGSGKSRASTRLLAEHKGMVALSGDDLRIFNPHYRQLVEARPEQAGEVLAEATRPWVRAALHDSLAERRSLLLEGTFGDPDITLATAARFREAGYHVRIVAIASPRVLSLVTAASRYLRDRKANLPARFTRLSAHDRGYDGTSRLIESLGATGLADQVTIVSRNGNALFDRLHDSEPPPDAFNGAPTALHEGRHPSSWGARSTMELLGELKQITAYATSSGHLTAETASLLIEAHVLALAEIVPNLSVATDSPQARFIEQAVSEQLVALRREAAPVVPESPGVSAQTIVASVEITVD
jgi:UDP-N-acetylglucosamine kinase